VGPAAHGITKGHPVFFSIEIGKNIYNVRSAGCF